MKSIIPDLSGPAAITPYSTSRGMEAASAMAKHSAMALAVVMAKKLLISLILWPVPRGPR